MRNLGIEPRSVSTGADLQSAVTNQQSPIPRGQYGRTRTYIFQHPRLGDYPFSQRTELVLKLILVMAEGIGIEPLPITAALGSNQLCHLDATL